ncbi:MAG: cell division protein ZapA [Treponema sp.]|nr:cell division protein ZapA [Treponema sp.]
MGLLQINLLGTSFSIKSDEDQEYLNKLLKYYKGVTDGLEKKGAFSNPLQIAIMAGIMMCDQVYSDKKKKVEIQEAIENNTLDERIDKITRDMISKIDTVI